MKVLRSLTFRRLAFVAVAASLTMWVGNSLARKTVIHLKPLAADTYAPYAPVQEVLPYDKEIEYLESTGTQYIDTGVVSQNNLVYDFYLEETRENQQRSFFGFKEIGNTWACVGDNSCNWGTGWFYVSFGGREDRISNFNYPNRNGLYHYDFTDGTAFWTFNGTRLWSASRRGTYDGSQHVHIFAMGAPSAINTPTYGYRRFYGRTRFVKVTKNGVLLRDFIPVRKGNVGYMYDRVSGKLYGNSGTGAFILGPDKN